MQEYVEGKENEVENDLDEGEPEITACTMKVSGFIKNCLVTSLIDLRSSHNFIDLG